MKTFIKTGERRRIFQGDRFEGVATVTRVHRQSDMEAAFVSVHFDGDEPGEEYDRWIFSEGERR